MTDPLAVKFVDGSDSMIEGLAIPYGGPAYLGGKDFDGERFDPETDLHLEWFPNEGRPFLFGHGMDPEIKTAVVGRQIERTPMDVGQWVRVQLDKRSKYLEHIQELVRAGALSFSSGAVPHLVSVDDTGTIKSWPWVELSGTPTPANPDALAYAVKTADAIEHLAAIRAEVPDALKEAIDGPPVPVAEPTYAELTESVAAQVKAWAKATEDRIAFRAKDGRGLGDANLEALRESHVLLGAALKEAERTPELEAEARRIEADFLRLQSRQLGVPV